MALPFGSATVARPSTTKFQMQGQKNHQVLGCVRPFIAPLERRMNTTSWTDATGTAKARPRLRGVRSERPTSSASPANNVNAGFAQLNASPR